MKEKPGELVINDRYHVESIILHTPVGYVYRAFDASKNNELVMLKELMPSSLLGINVDEVQDRYSRETSVLPQVKHPGIPHLLDHFAIGEHFYIVLEYFKGETLDSLSMKRTIPFPVRDVFSWAIQLCNILDVLHTAGGEPIIFRDLTPASIVITGDGEMKLGDFGLTRYFNPLKIKDTFVMGTPGFSPPEQYGRGQSDERSDIYSLGATLFYCLSLHSMEEFALKLPSLKKLNLLVPVPLEKIVQKCIEKDPRKRYQNVRQLSVELEKYRKDI